MYSKNGNYYYKKIFKSCVKNFSTLFRCVVINLYHFNLANAIFILKVVIDYREKYVSVLWYNKFNSNCTEIFRFSFYMFF